MSVNKILVTGGSGFIGTNVIKELLSNGNQVLNLDINKPKDGNYLSCWDNVDITNLDVFKKVVVKFDPDYIIHLAARTDLDGLTLDDYGANILGVKNLMSIIKELGALKKIVITSSMLVCRTGYYPLNQFDFSPTTIYGESKVLTEKIVWENKPVCDWAILRPTSIWGPWFGVPYKNFFDMVISKKYFHIGNNSCTKTYGFVGNSVYQILSILFTDTSVENKKIFFIGDNPPINIEVWGNEIGRELGFKIRKVPYIFIKLAALLGDCLQVFHWTFPMNSFRLKNMTTDNIVNLDNTYEVAPNQPYNRIEGVRETLNWINDQNK